MSIDKHDEYIGYILGVSHLISLIFAGTVANGRIPYSELSSIGSTTFDSQMHVTGVVVEENQDLYYEIQSMNSRSEEVLSALRSTLDKYSEAILNNNREDFRELMEKARIFFEKTDG